MVLDYLEPVMQTGGIIMDFHCSDFFPERFFDLVFVLRTTNTTLYGRYEQRGYSQVKIKNNIEAEIFGVCAEEARESYKSQIVFELKNEEEGDVARNAHIVFEKLKQFNIIDQFR